MREKHITHEELSAYLDGEAKRPEVLAAHLQECAECARRHMDLARLSNHMKSLPACDVSPAFATRVVAHAAETERLRATFWRPVMPFGLAALALVVGGWFAFHGWNASTSIPE